MSESVETKFKLTNEQYGTYLLYNRFLEHISKNNVSDRSEIDLILNKMNLAICKQLKIKNVMSKTKDIKKHYQYLVDKHIILPNEDFELLLRNKASKTNSGIVVLSIALEGRMYDDIRHKYPRLDKYSHEDIIDIPPTINQSKEKGGCEFNCHFCPFETKELNKQLNQNRAAIDIEDFDHEYMGNVNSNIISYDKDGKVSGTTMARSYLSSEGVFTRALISDFLPDIQTLRRLIELERLGHNIDKIVFIPRGATASNFNRKYWELFIRDVFWACNQFYRISTRNNGEYKYLIDEWLSKNPFVNGLPFDIDNKIRNLFDPKGTLNEEKMKNESAFGARIVEIAIEDRPDVIVSNSSQLAFYRKLGCTSFESGIQHTNRRILRINNRGHDIRAPIKCLNMVSDAYFKTHSHIMTDLPGSSPKDDLEMLIRIYNNDDLVFYNVKNYPCLPIPFAEIYKMREKWLELKKNGDTEEIEHIVKTMSSDITYRHLQQKDYIWAPYAETNYEDFLHIMLIAVAGISMKDAKKFDINLYKLVNNVNNGLDYRLKGNIDNQKFLNYYKNIDENHRFFLNYPDERKSRIQRDFPIASNSNNFNGYVSTTQQNNLGQILKSKAMSLGHNMFDIRSREIKDNKVFELSKNTRLYIRCKRANGGVELTLTIEAFKNKMINLDDTYLLGILRLRFRDYDIEKQHYLNNNWKFTKPPPAHFFEEFKDPNKTIVGITEVHTFGVMNAGGNTKSNSQHRGIGKFLLSTAELIVKDLGFQYLCVISGVGVRNYYRHLGYCDYPYGNGEYLVKNLENHKIKVNELFGTQYNPNNITTCVRNFTIIKNRFGSINKKFKVPRLPFNGIFIYNHPLIQKGDYETGIISSGDGFKCIFIEVMFLLFLLALKYLF